MLTACCQRVLAIDVATAIWYDGMSEEVSGEPVEALLFRVGS